MPLFVWFLLGGKHQASRIEYVVGEAFDQNTMRQVFLHNSLAFSNPLIVSMLLELVALLLRFSKPILLCSGARLSRHRLRVRQVYLGIGFCVVTFIITEFQ